MAIEPEVISSSSNKGRRAVRYFPRWAIYGTGGVFVLFFVSLIKALLPMIGMALLLAFIWSQSNTTRRF